MSNARASEISGILGGVPPQNATAGSYDTGWINVAEFGRLLGIIYAGTLGSSATITAKLQQANTSGGGAAKDITNKAITQFSQSPVDQSNSQWEIDCRAEELDAANGFDYVKLTLTVGTATSYVAALLIGFEPRHTPTTSFDNASVLGVAN